MQDKIKSNKTADDAGPYGSSFDDFLFEHGILAETRDLAAKSIQAWRFRERWGKPE